MVQSNVERILSSWEERKACSLRGLSQEKQGVNAPKMGKPRSMCLVLPMSSLLVDASVPIYSSIRKCTCSRDFHSKSNQGNYYEQTTSQRGKGQSQNKFKEIKKVKIEREYNTSHKTKFWGKALRRIGGLSLVES